MKTMLCLLCSILFLLSVGCAKQPPSQTELLSADYGLFPDNHKETIQTYMSRSLKDPYSAQYSSWMYPRRGWFSPPFKNSYYYGYSVCVWINAKNSYGGYVGARQFYFMLKNDAVLYHDGGYPSSVVGSQSIAKLCSGG